MSIDGNSWVCVLQSVIPLLQLCDLSAHFKTWGKKGGGWEISAYEKKKIVIFQLTKPCTAICRALLNGTYGPISTPVEYCDTACRDLCCCHLQGISQALFVCFPIWWMSLFSSFVKRAFLTISLHKRWRGSVLPRVPCAAWTCDCSSGRGFSCVKEFR